MCVYGCFKRLFSRCFLCRKLLPFDEEKKESICTHAHEYGSKISGQNIYDYYDYYYTSPFVDVRQTNELLANALPKFLVISLKLLLCGNLVSILKTSPLFFCLFTDVVVEYQPKSGHFFFHFSLLTHLIIIIFGVPLCSCW